MPAEEDEFAYLRFLSLNLISLSNLTTRGTCFNVESELVLYISETEEKYV